MSRILHDLLYMLPLCILALTSGATYLSGPESNAFSYICTFGALAMCVMLKYWKNRLKYLFPAVIIALFAGLMLIRPAKEWGAFLSDYGFLLWAFAAGLVGFIVGRLWVTFRLIAGFLSIALIAGLILIMVFDSAPDKLMIDAAVFLPVLFAAEEIQRHWKKQGYPDTTRHMVSIAPFLIVLGLAVYISPASDEPYDWNFAVRIWEGATDVIKWAGELFTGPEEEYDAIVGFSESGSFQGSLTDVDETVMTMSDTDDPADVVYLRGKVMDSFDGRSWTDTYSAENNDSIIDVIETLCAVNNYAPDNISDYLRKAEMKLKYDDFNSAYIFAPIKVMPRWDHIDNREYTQTGGNLISDEILGDGTEYTIPFYRTNNDHAAFGEFLRTAPSPDKNSWEQSRTIYESEDTSRQNTDGRGAGVYDASFSAYSEYKKRINNYYLQTPKLFDNTTEYLQKLLDGAETDYDRLSRIETALSAFHYTTDPGVLPEEITTPDSFLDYFLFKKQEGYCSYFATAFVLMSRSVGIPARYVQGFRVKKNKTGITEVKSSMSHAWPEAYIEGVGWITFEPTPGKKRRVAWSVSGESSGVSDQVASQPVRPEINIPDQVTQETETEHDSGGFNWNIVIICVALLIIVIIVFLITDRIISSTRYRRLNETDKFRAICRRNFRILELLGYRLRQGETLEEFYNRTGEKINTDALGFLTQCELMAYAGKAVSTDIIYGAMRDQGLLLDNLKAEKGRYYFWYRFKLRNSKT